MSKSKEQTHNKSARMYSLFNLSVCPSCLVGLTSVAVLEVWVDTLYLRMVCFVFVLAEGWRVRMSFPRVVLYGISSLMFTQLVTFPMFILELRQHQRANDCITWDGTGRGVDRKSELEFEYNKNHCNPTVAMRPVIDRLQQRLKRTMDGDQVVTEELRASTCLAMSRPLPTFENDFHFSIVPTLYGALGVLGGWHWLTFVRTHTDAHCVETAAQPL
jgi:hypothetical protein